MRLTIATFLIATLVLSGGAVLSAEDGGRLSAEDIVRSIAAANKRSFGLLRQIEIAKSKAVPQLDREESFANLADMTPERAAGNWFIVKDGLLDLLIADPNFFFSQMDVLQSFFNEYLESFHLSWLYGGLTNFPQKKQLAVRQIEREIESLENRLDYARKFKKKIESTEPRVVD